MVGTGTPLKLTPLIITAADLLVTSCVPRLMPDTLYMLAYFILSPTLSPSYR